MIDFAGVSGKLKALAAQITAGITTITDAVATRAAAATALSNATWPDALAAYLATTARRKPVALIINNGGIVATTLTSTGPNLSGSEWNLLKVASGALTANTLKTLIDRTGAGKINFLTVTAQDTTSRTMRIKITIDGVVVYNVTSAANVTNGGGIIAIGAYGPTAAALVYGCVEYDTSFKVEIASSLTETNKLAVFSNEETRA